MKLSQLATVVAQSEQIATITIYQPNGQPYTGTGGECTISFTGSESKAYLHERTRIQRRALNRRKMNTEPADVLRNRIDLAAAAVTGWANWEDDNDEPAPCTPQNVKNLLQVEHILVQLEEGIAGHADFFAKPSGT